MSFRGASADAYAAVRGVLDGVAGADAGRVGDDLFTVSQLLRSEPALRRVATDPSVATQAKQGLARQLFEGKIDGLALAAVEKAFGQRWTASRDLADALETLSEISVVRSAGDDENERLSDELFEVGQAVQHNAELRDALSDPARSVADKSALLDTILGGKALPATVTLVKQALAGTYRTVNAALETYQKVAAEVHGERVATVRVAKPLSTTETERLQAALSRQYGRSVHLNVVIDPDVIGGIRVEIGDDVIDGTVSSRLDDARRKLAG